jgi:hypothetical protein
MPSSDPQPQPAIDPASPSAIAIYNRRDLDEAKRESHRFGFEEGWHDAVVSMNGELQADIKSVVDRMRAGILDEPAAIRELERLAGGA